MKNLKDWCKHCFGMKTVQERLDEELKHAYQETYTLTKQVDWAKAQLFYYEHRIQLILSTKQTQPQEF